MFFISDAPERLDIAAIHRLLQKTYWAAERDEATVRASVEASLCFGAYATDTGAQIGFARIITDYATTFYLCDVVVDKAWRGRGVGKALVDAALTDRRIQNLRGFLATADAHGLYARYGFRREQDRYMSRG